MNQPSQLIVLAAAAHPDDIEFLFGGTLLLLRELGCSVHMWNLLDGSCGSLTLPSVEIAALRAEEASRSASLAGASIHSALFPDLGVFYDRPSLAAVGAVIRKIRPQIVLTHSPHDYMEDHQNVCRLVTTAVFGRGMPNFQTQPPTQPYSDPVRLYHAPPHGLADGLGEPFEPDLLVDVGSVIETKARMLECHRSQFVWLDDTQGMASPVAEMRQFGERLAALGDRLEFAEGWRRHSHLGFCPPDFDPLADVLGPLVQNLKTNT